MKQILAIRRLALPVFILVSASGGCETTSTPDRSAESITLRLNESSPAQVEVAGLPDDILGAIGGAFLRGVGQDEWKRALALYVVQEDVVTSDEGSGLQAQLPILGAHVVIGGAFGFQPKFPLRPGIKYQARFDPDALATILNIDNSARQRLPRDVLTLTIELPAPPSPTTIVTAIYPSADVLPENLLKFYIHFSAPMGRGEAYERVRLEKANGEIVPTPFLELSEELWDRDGQRFTLFFEPGRIKRGVMLRDEIGPALVAGEEYVLVVDAAWRDAEGNPLGDSYRKAFRVVPLDTTQPDPKQWKITPPKAGTSEPLVVEFNEPLDHAMLARVIQVSSPAGEFITGTIAVERGESAWRFTPDEAWPPGNHELVVAGTLEDLAGNSIGRPFEVSLTDDAARMADVVQEVRVPFQVAE